MASDSNTKKVNLALQGGGARGAFTWGVLDKFLEDGRLVFEGISATSAGSLNAVILAQGLLKGGNEKARELLHTFWHDLGKYGRSCNQMMMTPADLVLSQYLKAPIGFYIFRYLINVFSPYQFNPFNINPIRDMLEKIVDFNLLQNQDKVHLFISATNVKTGKLHVFEKQEITTDAILASSCLPDLFHAVEIGGNYYWDGGYLGNPAIYPLIYNTDSKDIIVLHTSPFKRTNIPYDASDISHRMREISFNSSLVRELRAIAFITKMIQEGWIKEEYVHKLKPIYMHCLDADHVLQEISLYSTYNMDWSYLLKLHRLGRKAATAWLAENFDAIGTKSTIDFNEWL